MLTWGLDSDMLCRWAEDEPEEGSPHMLLMALRGSGTKELTLEVKPVKRFIHNLAYLIQLTEVDTLPQQLYRVRHPATLFVISHDASRKTKGAVVVLQYGQDYESGVWFQHWQGKSSNIREAKNC
jgi:hypothetical protein